MDNPQNIDSNTYAVSSSATSQYAVLIPSDRASSRVIITNVTSQPCYVLSSDSSSSTAAFPTSATIPVMGKVVPSGAVLTFSKSTSEGYIHVVSAAPDSGKYVYISVGSGE